MLVRVTIICISLIWFDLGPCQRSHSVQSHISKAPSALFEQPWREVSEKYKDNREFVKSYQPQNKQVKHIRILLHGPVGAGKSSFINSVDTVLKGRPAGRAATNASYAGSSFTKQYKTFKFHKNPEATYSFVLNDVMGLEEDSDSGVSVEDVKQALRGHVKEGYKFNPDQELKEGVNGYNSDPTLGDKVHVLVCVIPVDSVCLLSDKVVEKVKEVRMAASELGIPQLAILTRVDEACPEVKKDTSNIYKSKYLKEKVDIFHQLLGLPINCIFLVRNYNPEIESNDKMNAAIVCALKQMLLYGEDFLNDLET
ncbi:interferon-induced protein 44-like isoform X2 [Pleuronectes platessa]|uniref:interferon-induced protein 44-like isoform X2 n=1 Tax=Pleuronectes platessa TaxID=8262 RepID=UPI00232A5EE9|nr:interferon-induced protein 44-like isoform X2 [Pleuronectes platessa]